MDGGLGAFVPVDEVSFKRLLALQKLMTYALPHMAGLNPKDFRCVPMWCAVCVFVWSISPVSRARVTGCSETLNPGERLEANMSWMAALCGGELCVGACGLVAV